MTQTYKTLPEPTGMTKDMIIDGKSRPVYIFPMREGNSEVFYAYFHKPYTDFGISASVRRIG